jgi:macrolide transport system ATP-binding/permease protein
MAEALIQVRDLWRVYTLGDVEVQAVRGVSTDIAAGEFVAVMGASGSGKSTFMNILGCLDRPTRGTYRLAGEDVSTLSADQRATIRNRQIGFVFQSFNLIPRTSAVENVELPLFYSDVPLGQQHQRARDVLAAVGLSGREEHLPNQLSGGQQQRVVIARALVNRPSLLLADEPTGNLDTQTSREILDIFQRLNREQGITVVLVTHEPDIAAFAERVLTFRDGQIVSDAQQTSGKRQSSAVRVWKVAQASSLGGTGKMPVPPWGPRMKLLRMTLRTALRALRRNKMRSALTMLGIIIGVAAVITMVSIGQGADAAVQQQILSLGTNMLMVIPGATTSSGVRSGWGGVSTLTAADAQVIKRECPAVADVSFMKRQIVQIVYGDRNWSTAAQGSTPSYQKVRNWPVAAGSFFTQRDEDAAARVVVLGQTVVDNLFGSGEDPVGATLRIKDVPFRVIGVLESKGQTTWGQDQDDVLIMPFSTAERRVLGTQFIGSVDMVFVSAASVEDIAEAQTEIVALLHERHHIQPGHEDDFTVRNLNDIAKASESASKVMTSLLLSVASISLLVGGIGIMNILLVSVTERTREIGIRMAVGAKSRHILLQFIVEAVALSMVGGLAGTLIGIAGARLISYFAKWPTLLSAPAVIGAFLFSGAVGVFFGFYPARKASRLDPIAALRYE